MNDAEREFASLLKMLRSGTAGNEAARSGTMLSSHGVEPV